MDLIKGVDISVLQGKVDFVALAATGIKFVICRCGVGNESRDVLYEKNIAAAKAAGLKVMAYNFVYPLPTTAAQPLRAAKAQAKLHVDWAEGELAACDLEWPAPQDWAKWGCSASQIVEWVTEYLEEYERLSGIRPLIYIYPNFADNIHLPQSFGEKYKLWIASYTNTPRIPKPWTDWVLWQDSGGTQKLPNGVPVDMNKAKDLSLWGDSVPVPVEEAAPTPMENPEPQTPVIVPPEVVTVASKSIFDTLLSLLQPLIKLFTKK